MTDFSDFRISLLEEENRLLREQVSDTQRMFEEFILTESPESNVRFSNSISSSMQFPVQSPDTAGTSDLLCRVRENARSAARVIEIGERGSRRRAHHILRGQPSRMISLPSAAAESALRRSKESLDDARRKEFQSRLLHVQSENARLLSECVAAREQARGLMVTVERMTSELREARDERDAAAAEAAEAQTQVGNLEGELERLTSELGNVRKEREAAAAQSAEAQTQVGNLKGELERLTSELGDVRKEREAAAAESAEAQTQVGNLKGELERLTSELGDVRKEREAAAAESAEAQTQVGNLKGELERLTSELGDARDEREAAAAEAAEAKTQVEGLESELDQLTKGMEKADHERKMAVKKGIMRENDLTELQEQYSALMEKSEEMERLYDQLQKQVETAWSCLVELTDESETESSDDLASRLVHTLRVVSSRQ